METVSPFSQSAIVEILTRDQFDYFVFALTEIFRDHIPEEEFESVDVGDMVACCGIRLASLYAEDIGVIINTKGESAGVRSVDNNREYARKKVLLLWETMLEEMRRGKMARSGV